MKEQPFNIHNTEQWLWFAIWFTLPISIQLNSIAILFAIIVFSIRAIKKPPTIKKEYLLYTIPVILYFILQLIPLGDRILQISSWKEIEQQLPLLAFPLLFMLSNTDKRNFTKIASSGLFFAVIIASIIMISESIFRFFNDFDFSVFTYHNLAEPFDAGAIYFSFFIVLVLFRINEMHWLFKDKRVGVSAILILILVLFLLASKLILVLGVILILIKHANYILNHFKNSRLIIPLVIVIFMILLIPIGQRFLKIYNPRFDIVNSESYSYDSPLNGLNLRLIQSRFGIEILNEHNAWVFGVGMDQSQELLNATYIEKGIYTGYKNTDDSGYLNYNFHNQYMETLVRSGIVGLFALLFIIFVLLATSNRNKFATLWEIGLILLFFITESVLERQIGIVYFCILFSSYFPVNLTNKR